MYGWNDYLKEHRAKGEDNVFAPQQTVAKGLSDARYAFLFWNLAPREALVIETDEPRARYWGLQLATMGWFEQVDPIHRITSINHRQAIPSADGLIRFVLAHEDLVSRTGSTPPVTRDLVLTWRRFWPEIVQQAARIIQRKLRDASRPGR